LDDMEAIFGLHEVRRSAFGERKRGVFKLLDGLASNDPAEIAALILRAGVFGVFLGEVLKLGTGLLRLFEDIVSLLLDFRDFRVGLTDGHEQNVLDFHAIGNLVLLDVALILSLKFVVGNLSALADLIRVDQRVSDYALFRNHVAGAVLVVSGFDLVLGGIDLGFEILGLDQGVFELDLFVAIFELVLKFLGPYADAVGDQLLEFLNQQRLADGLFKLRHGHLRALLDDLSVAIHADEGVPVVGHREDLADAVGALPVGDMDAEALGFVLEFLLEDQVAEDGADVVLLHHLELRAGTALLIFAETVADVAGSDRVAAHGGDRVGGSIAAIAGHRRDEIKQHATCENENHGAEKDARER